jgi:predicted nucleotidyltransferase component of viral defense system
MKRWRPTYIAQAELVQLILLANLYGQSASNQLFFQGGTAIRWCYGARRFSEDLDFETHLPPHAIQGLFRRALPGIKRDLTATLGAGKFELETERCLEPLCTVWAKFSPANSRGKIAVKLEFQQSRLDMTPETRLFIFGMQPAIVDIIQSGRLKTRDNAVLVVETLSEILAGKIRALLEREHYKGRDFWDIWYLCDSRQVKIDSDVLERKLCLYPFTLRHPKTDILKALRDNRPDGPVIKAITDDLRRFIPTETFTALENSKFAPLLSAVQELLLNVPDTLF